MATHPQPKGDRCAFPRNLTRGTYGGDVNCLQQHLFHQARRSASVRNPAAANAAAELQLRAQALSESATHARATQGFLTEEEPTGYFGTHTEAALRKWQASDKRRAPAHPGVPRCRCVRSLRALGC
jgi:hypothetical protein